jgi:Subtilase family
MTTSTGPWNRIAARFNNQGNALSAYKHILRIFPGVTMQGMFTSVSPSRIEQLVSNAKKMDPGYNAPDLFAYYMLTCPAEININKLLGYLHSNSNVELAYAQPQASVPPGVYTSHPLSSLQGYLERAPAGINARYAWTIKGGDGSGRVRFIDIERGWLLEHRDVNAGTLPCTGINDWRYEEHGIAVLGVIMMQANSIGGIGITPCVAGHVISEWRHDGSHNLPDAILAAIDQLSFGDVLLLQSQVYCYGKDDTAWPVETEEAVWQMIRLATASGIIVIEPAGNGNSSKGRNLSQFIDASGKRTLNCESPYFKDSGAIMVAAASSSDEHSRLLYSNYGNRVNCFAWGENVLTTGSYPGTSGAAINTYTHRFGGTSSAAAIITGAAIAVQSISEANRNKRLGPAEMRSILGNETYGTRSAKGRAAGKIGVMPDLKKIIEQALNVGPEVLSGHKKRLNGSIVRL